MSEEETQLTSEDGQMLAEYNDGQLQIVEVAAFDQGRYVQVLDNDKGVMNLDLLSLIKSEGNPTFQLVGTSTGDDDTVTCVLANHNAEIEENEKDTYVILDTEDGRDPLVYLQSTLQQINTQNAYRDDKKTKKLLTPEQIVQKAKILQKANMLRSRGVGRRRKGDIPPPTEMLSLLATPGFKLYLYNCKLCSFKCNAIKEMSKHKASEHSGKNRPGGSAGRSSGPNMQCAQCPYRATGHMQLMKHIKDKHSSEEEETTELVIECDDMSDADVLVCGACGFESSQRDEFREHIETTHGFNVTLSPSLVALSENTSEAHNLTEQQSNSKEEYIIS